jgi:hypothetical protein
MVYMFSYLGNQTKKEESPYSRFRGRNLTGTYSASAVIRDLRKSRQRQRSSEEDLRFFASPERIQAYLLDLERDIAEAEQRERLLVEV